MDEKVDDKKSNEPVDLRATEICVKTATTASGRREENGKPPWSGLVSGRPASVRGLRRENSVCRRASRGCSVHRDSADQGAQRDGDAGALPEVGRDRQVCCPS